MATQDELLDAWERQFPTSGVYRDEDPFDLARPDREGERQADEYVEQAALRLGHPVPPRTVGLTRGDQADQRIELARRAMRAAERHGGDAGSAMREMHEATDELSELIGLGLADERVDLDRTSSARLNGPSVRSPWHPAN